MSAALTAASPPALSPVALRLGHFGLLPFVLGAALIWLVHPPALPYVAQGLSSYAALVLALLGGVHWGIGFAQTAPPPSLFAWGSVPAPLAWVAVMMPARSGLVLAGVLLVACYLIDRKVYARHGLGRWLTLRFRLSAVAALSCFLGAAGA
ncbi:DUF3429 domain-containing protein [Aquincola sp. S2]|uniref:DUF3429 domain-containing protein n=1 Tax=Pseudaquabacterium terrae TaxID=2732868 RepID=A0ABX2EDU4_9BURK|nr:DUF3429 domain-containing protein [Aquabacterium terrae]NRF66782.1 DUF3429 domain-containing protein [Aquabacterium terrae]